MRLPLLDKEYGDCAGKNKNSAAEAEICSFATCVPLCICLAEQIEAHQRNAQIDCLRPYIKDLQYCQCYDSKADDNGKHGDYFVRQGGVFPFCFHSLFHLSVAVLVESPIEGLFCEENRDNQSNRVYKTNN